MNVLFIGNSLTADAVEHLPRIFKNMGITNVNLYAVYRGGFTLPRYVEVYDEPNSCALFYCRAGHEDWEVWDVKQDDCLKDIVNLQPWDVISIQEHTGAEEAWSWTPREETAIKTLVERFNNAHPDHLPTMVYLMSHVYGNVRYQNNGSLGEIRRRQQQDVGDMPQIHQAAQGAHSDKYHNSLCHSRPESPHIRIELDSSDGHVP